jgi:hypothetical protein
VVTILSNRVVESNNDLLLCDCLTEDLLRGWRAIWGGRFALRTSHSRAVAQSHSLTASPHSPSFLTWPDTHAALFVHGAMRGMGRRKGNGRQDCRNHQPQSRPGRLKKKPAEGLVTSVKAAEPQGCSRSSTAVNSAGGLIGRGRSRPIYSYTTTGNHSWCACPLQWGNFT